METKTERHFLVSNFGTAGGELARRTYSASPLFLYWPMHMLLMNSSLLLYKIADNDKERREQECWTNPLCLCWFLNLGLL
ncbi:unnamed protein product, partial [Arabidopsis halleri]